MRDSRMGYLYVNYSNEIEEEQLEDENMLKNIIHEGMGRFMGSDIPLLYLNNFKSTILTYKIDYLKTVNLYRLNYAILAVACVEYAMYPDQNYEQYLNIYSCSRSSSKKLYNKLNSFPDRKEQKDSILVSTRSFFKCLKLKDQPDFLKMIRAYLKNIEIDNYELSYIREASIKFIHDNEASYTAKQQLRSSTQAGSSKPVKRKLTSLMNPLNQTEKCKTLMTKEYFLNKCNANAIINLQEYLIVEEIEDESLEDKRLLWDMLQKAMKRFLKKKLPTNLEFNTFKSTLLNFKVDYLKVANLYRISHGILVVACIEYILFPGKSDEEYLKIYSCNQRNALKLYNKLRGFSEQKEKNTAIVKSARSFFRYSTFLNNTESSKAIRSYLGSIEINDDELKYIKEASIQLIHYNAANYTVNTPPNIIVPIEDR
ncbi:uncharacterized protein LOC106652720 isoform X2 [Trichogramma pretiosum]|uniref:uncharacterized protein LOC106652720 isoform X2 n=1 Tax=Trichogramma pretiosum TaxID=7493 RepID=UPI0006C9E43A|nr:uncharacterized protein LOC106652720 isoform X2 [Trichogramma pretiosum]